ncbi:MAG: bifunctional diaminohydroxyphosphoribosylaminopyrimidine deaminase/5-amino-6-(5-phosphoribosylamino)uracil reductase RibD [Bacteroidetes bacterium]|nr:bifunctional diaminohydroxyphosphoribosylaminopyrimidine deaminase/5-amino-6-(5-phosphoribosylamino)uracil reductase RibD [Bacteroidota bacterium]MDA1119190.1 bifunctional diaminohydroxyphosphoribosylaminopyrimidine deaminase/5-amino-6-(5-phosphoribosylamino)uracil reductase RibD [Bacteroidota bacterium]
MDQHQKYMQRALELAQLGLGNVSPNPMVGCVIVKDNRIIGEGHHMGFGGPHAEVNAVWTVKDKTLLKNADVYVTLEPCAHQGKTPPCADLLIDHKVGRVFIANSDPNPLVNGNGIKKIKSANIEMTTGILQKEGEWLNRRFFTAIQKNRPYVILKWAQTADGFIARDDFDSKWISNEYSRKLVHKWRNEEDSILVGKNTAFHDNPELTTRDWANNRNPLRCVIDKNLELKKSLKLFSDGQTICFNCKKSETEESITYVQLNDDRLFIDNCLAYLNSKNVQSLIVEGGAALLNSFIDQNLWDEARVFTSQERFKKGIMAPAIEGQITEETQIIRDSLSVFVNK